MLTRRHQALSSLFILVVAYMLVTYPLEWRHTYQMRCPLHVLS
jgi:hypothetical protein